MNCAMHLSLKRLGVFVFSPLMVLLFSGVVVTTAKAQDKQGALKAYNSGDYKTAMRNWMYFAKRGDAASQFAVAQMFRLGKGIDVNLEESFKWMTLAAQGNYVPAQYNLGVMLLKGDGTFPDQRHADYWLKEASQAGSVEAQNILETRLSNTESKKVHVSPVPSKSEAVVLKSQDPVPSENRPPETQTPKTQAKREVWATVMYSKDQSHLTKIQDRFVRLAQIVRRASVAKTSMAEERSEGYYRLEVGPFTVKEYEAYCGLIKESVTVPICIRRVGL